MRIEWKHIGYCEWQHSRRKLGSLHPISFMQLNRASAQTCKTNKIIMILLLLKIGVNSSYEVVH